MLIPASEKGLSSRNIGISTDQGDPGCSMLWEMDRRHLAERYINREYLRDGLRQVSRPSHFKRLGIGPSTSSTTTLQISQQHSHDIQRHPKFAAPQEIYF